MIITLYANDGRYVGVVGGQGLTLETAARLGHRMLEGEHTNTYLNADDQPVAWLEFKPIITGNEIAGLPEGATLTIDNQLLLADNGKVRLGVQYDERFSGALKHPAYRDKTITIEATAAANHDHATMLQQDYAKLRRLEYNRRGLSMDALTIALIEGDDAEIERIRTERDAVKKDIPK